MTAETMLKCAAAQSARELCCRADDFFARENVIVESGAVEGARRYLRLPFDCQLVSYGANVVASCRRDVRPAVETYLAETSPAHGFETPGIHRLDKLLAPFGLQTCHMAEYFLPVSAHMPSPPCPYPTRLFEPPSLAPFYLPQWRNALCIQRKEDDRLLLVAYDGERPVGAAGASADCDGMWQIGIDVLPAYRRQGIAAALSAKLADEIFRRGKIPFYCAAWCNLPSVRNALASGFRPAWVELTAKPIAEVAALFSQI